MKKIICATIGVALAMIASVATADQAIDVYAESPAFCQPSGNMTEAMKYASDVKCAEYKRQVEAGTFVITKSACTGGTFQVDAMGNSCPDTFFDRVGEFVAVAVLATAIIEVGAAAIGGGDVGGIFYGGDGLFHTSGKLGAAVAGF